MNWILLILSLPSDNATARTRIWRTLKSLGCGTLRDGAWLLPQREDLETILRHQAEEARTAGGNAWLLSMGGQGEADRDLAALFDRGPEYAALDQALDRLADPAQDGGQDAPTLKKLLRGLRRQFEQLAAIDYFPGPARQASEARLERVARLVRARINPGEPGARDARIERLDPADYRGRLWATRRDLWVDRLASAWLIRRRIDPAARFLWLDHPAECPDAALGFDFDGGGLRLLAEARLHQLRRPRRADRHHAPGAGGEAALDFRAAFPARPQLLHGAARPRGDPARHLHRLAAAPHLGRHRRRHPVRAAVAVHPGGPHLCLLAFGDLTFVQGVFNGIKPAVVAIVVFAAWRIGSRALKNGLLWAMAAASFIAIFFFDMPFPAIVLAAGILGFIGGKADARQVQGGRRPRRQQQAIRPGPDRRRHPAAGPCKFAWRRLGVPLRLRRRLGRRHGRDRASRPWPHGRVLHQGRLPHHRRRLCRAALRLPGRVEHYGWLTGTQMIDGLALGETTPGPLIMVVAFVGFVGAWTKEIFGPDALFLAGFAGASVATFFTFLPSFVFILAGAPLVESTHGDLKFTAPLTGITAAVVGVILNLAMFFGWHVIWPRATEAAPFSGGFEWFYALISVAAFVALWKYKQDIMRVIAACAVVGLVHTLIGA
jgi:chromate transporter